MPANITLSAALWEPLSMQWAVDQLIWEGVKNSLCMQSYILLYLLFSRNGTCKENHLSNIWKNDICYIRAKRLGDRQEIIIKNNYNDLESLSRSNGENYLWGKKDWVEHSEIQQNAALFLCCSRRILWYKKTGLFQFLNLDGIGLNELLGSVVLW